MQVQATAWRLLRAGLPAPVLTAGERKQEAPAPKTDSVTISQAGRAAAGPFPETGAPEQPAEPPRQPDGFDFSGVDLDSFDWDSWEMPTLGGGYPRWRREIDPEEYRKKKMELLIRNYKEIEDRVRAHYQPEYDKIKGMSKDEALHYLWDTYQRPFSTNVLDSRTPRGMGKEEAEMAYDQLLYLYCYHTTALLADPYALSPSDIRDLNAVDRRTKEETDQYFKDAWDAAHPGYDPEKEKAERKAAFRKIVETINSTNLKDLPPSACLSKEVLSLPEEGEAPGGGA